MVGNVPEGIVKMPPGSAKIEPDRLAERLRALPGLDRVREVAGETPIYLVGGAVRDLLLGRERTDLDIAVEGDAAVVGRRLGGEIRTHERFATATVHLDGAELDLATARSETYPRPGALPEVRPALLSDDLARRDFTVNAMALPLAGEPELIDPHGGLGDLEDAALRILHERSFVDDPTRALRAARYAARYGFALEAQTEALLRQADLDTVSEDRIQAELRKLAREPRARRGFELLDEWGLMSLGEEASELIDSVGDVVASEPWASLVPRDDAVLAAALGRDLASARQLAGVQPGAPSEAVELARGHDGVTLALARAVGADWLDRYVSEWRNVQLNIDGDDLLAAGIPEGPAVGRGLAAAMRARLDGEAADAAEELRIALDAARDADSE
jgi:tRNA nucleotidyltransferase (CCA-adding enzyme)